MTLSKHHFLLSVDHRIFAFHLIIKPPVLNFQCLLNIRLHLVTAELLVLSCKGSCLLYVSHFLRENGMLFVDHFRSNVGLVELFLKGTLGFMDVLHSSVFEFDLHGFKI